MSFWAIQLLALGLALDAMAVAAVRGVAAPEVELRHVARIAALFGGFQAAMPLCGWLIGSRAGHLVQAWDHWIAFGLLGAIGGKMIWDARRAGGGADSPSGDPFATAALLVLAVATSIDALAVGITLPMLGAPLALSLVTIGVTAAVLSAAGVYAGRRFGAGLGGRLDLVGGLVLIGLGIKILIEHLWLR